MSTKIYNGFKFADQDFLRIHQQLEDLRAFIKVDARLLTIELLREWVIRELDGHASACKEIEPRLLGRKCVELWDRQRKIKETKRRDPVVDFEFELVILVDPDTKEFYGIFYTEQKDWDTHVRALPWYVDFSYWNNTDPPKGITDEEWAARGETWDRLVGWTPPSQRGYSFEVETTLIFTDKMTEEFLDPTKLPTMEQRIERQAKIDATDFHFRQNYTHDAENFSTSKAMKALREAQEWIKTEDGEEFIRRRRDDLSTILKPLTKEVIVD